MKKSFLVILPFVILASILFLILEDRLRTPEIIQPEKPIFGSIVPHDFSVEYMNIELIKKLAWQKPKLIILLAPNHFESGRNNVTVFNDDWQVSSYGKIGTEKEFVDDLVGKKLAGVNNDIFSQEYSVGNNMVNLYIYLPEIKVVPIIFKKNCSLEELRTLSEYIAAKVDKDTVILASVDFSHYLSYAEAKKMDEITLDEMRKFNYDKILHFDSKNLDSPAAIAILLMLVQKQGRTNMEILHYMNSAEIKKSEAAPTTSYFSIIFH